MKIKKGDNVIILSGKDKGKTGIIEQNLINRKKMIISGINIAKRHMKPGKTKAQVGIIDKILPISISKVALICGNCQKITRVGYKITTNAKIRICKKCKEAI